MNVKGSKHLTLGERIAISELLVQNKSLNEIAEAINKDARTVSKEIKRNRQETLGKTLYKKLFRVILTDRGCEFTNPNTIEKDYKTGRKITNVFYCNSYASYQKGSIEQNHELIRYVIPKGHIFDNLNQDNINLLSSHINSYYRDTIETTPYILAKKYFGNQFLNKLKIAEIPKEQENLKPNLLN